MNQTVENIVSQGFELAVFGMGTVFVFLTLLILATHGMSLLVRKLEPESSKSTVKAVAQTDDRQLLAVISAAIAQHRNKRS
jgi:oxaloacetate decarboxylase (Na+ extruding) subunit gamma